MKKSLGYPLDVSVRISAFIYAKGGWCTVVRPEKNYPEVRICLYVSKQTEAGV